MAIQLARTASITIVKLAILQCSRALQPSTRTILHAQSVLKVPTCLMDGAAALRSVHLARVPLEASATTVKSTTAQSAISIGIMTSKSGLRGPAQNAMKSTKLLMAFVSRWR